MKEVQWVMPNQKKLSGNERRKYILRLLQNRKDPITGQEIAEKTGVSRQVIVTDIALLKTGNEPIIATNRGYLYMKKGENDSLKRRIIICQHTPEQTRGELEAIVDCGVTVVDVTVEHPFYGDLTGSLMISSRYDVEQFMVNFPNKETALLSVLTDGLHLHTLEADSSEKLDAACKVLEAMGILYSD